MNKSKSVTQLILDRTYGHFASTGEWPLSWQMERDLESELEPAGGLERVCRTLQPDVACGSPDNASSEVQLRLGGLLKVERAAIDIEAFLTLCRYAATVYRSAASQPIQITRKGFSEQSGIDDQLARRAFKIALLEGQFWISGSVEGFQLNRLAARMSDVNSVEDYRAVVARFQEQRAQQSIGHATGPKPRHFFLSHSSADATVAAYFGGPDQARRRESHRLRGLCSGSYPNW